ncbi:ATP-dependent RNA helicase [Podosphaera aphanis]|nr:ATP-dependent RNA helicase [Podosphaera aphanis]
MTDDGLLMNFEIGDAPIIPKQVYQGGRWRDRFIAKKCAAKRATEVKRPPCPSEREIISEKRNDHTVEDYVGPGVAPNPPKRQRIDDTGPRSSRYMTNGAQERPLSPKASQHHETKAAFISGKLPPGSISTAARKSMAIREDNDTPVTSEHLPARGLKANGRSSAHETKKSTFHQDTRSSFVAGKLPPGSINTSGGNSKKIVFEDPPKSTSSATTPSKQGVAMSKKAGQVISSLFSFNPTAKTTFEEPQGEVEPVKPSNAPLTAEMETFTALGLSTRLAAHLSVKLDMKAPTAIQKAAIPPMITADDDAFIQAETGSGKTLAYLLPIVQRIMAMSDQNVKVHRDSGLFAIVLAPTRELCKQIATVLEKLLRCAPWIVGTTVLGGESKQSEKARLRKGVNILIATPGRLADHLDNTEVLKVDTVKWLILDEGDRLMELGFEEEIKQIVSKLDRKIPDSANTSHLDCRTLPRRRITILCSATMKMNVQRLGEISLKDAVHIMADPTETQAHKEREDANQEDTKKFTAPAQLKQAYAVVPAKLRLVTLTAVLKRAFGRRGSVMKAIVFISCADSVDFHFSVFSRKLELSSDDEEDPIPTPSIVTTELTKDSIAHATAISSKSNSVILHRLHGSLTQNIRTATLKAFTESPEPCVMICTDVASRGLDLPNVDYVIEYDPPFSADDHLHRVGRTARAGKDGRALIFLMPGEEEEYVSILASGYRDGKKALTSNTAEVLLRNGFGGVGKEWEERATEWQLDVERWAQDSPKYLEMARRAFQSHIRAYATHVASERKIFNMQTLHLGHLAKAFALRDKPGSIKVPGLRPAKMTKADRNVAARKAKRGEVDDHAPEGERIRKQRKLDLDLPSAESNDVAKRMRKKMMEHLSAAREFNIG